MPDTKSIPEVGAIYLYPDMSTSRSQAKSRIPFVNFFRRKLNLDEDDLEEKRQALVKKSGGYRVRYTGLTGYRRRYLSDLYISLVDLKWGYALAVFFNIYLVTFLFFGILWWLIGYNHGDMDKANVPSWEPCVSGVYNFPKSLLFSIETQTTIGYGVAYPNTDCDGTVFLVYLQITIGILLDNILLGFVFVKFAQPKNRRKTILFSKNACVSHHDGDLVLQVRVGDIRKSHLLDAKVHGVLVRRQVTKEGILYPIYMNDVKFQADGMDDKLVLMWPMVLTHRITEDSPFWSVKPADLCNERWELIIYVEGTIETTGEFCQSRTSYTPRELLWGHRFDRIEEFDSGNGKWEIDFAGFNDVVYCSNIRHSAKELATFKENRTHLYDQAFDGEDEKEPIKTIAIKTVSYDTVPELPARDNLNRDVLNKGRLGRTGSERDVHRASRDSVISTEERGYQTADDDTSITDQHKEES